MKLKFCFIFLGMFLLFVPTAFADFDREAFEIFQLINRERYKYRLSAFEWDDDLADVAENYSEQMAKSRFFSHYDKKGLTVVDRAMKEGITQYRKIGENLFYCLNCPDFESDSVKGWLKSPSHRRSIFDNFTATGIGIAESKDGGIYITQVFLKR
jgi:uncharacterized protein YkwD